MNSNSDRELAISYITEHRQIHLDWASWQQSNPDWRSEIKPDDPGGPEHHLECAKRHDLVLRVLQGLSDE